MKTKKILSLLISVTILLIFSVSNFMSSNVFSYPNGWVFDDDTWRTEDERPESEDSDSDDSDDSDDDDSYSSSEDDDDSDDDDDDDDDDDESDYDSGYESD
jgi:hypothetical protein